MTTSRTARRGWSELARPRADDRLSDLYSAHGQRAGKLALLLTGDVQAAQDITQEAFARVGGRLKRLRDPDQSAGYLYRTVQNLARDHGRSLKRQRDLGQRLQAKRPEHSVDPRAHDEVWAGLMQLPLKQRTALFLRYYLDLSESEAAEALDLSVAAMKSLTHRATQGLRRQLQGSDK